MPNEPGPQLSMCFQGHGICILGSAQLATYNVLLRRNSCVHGFSAFTFDQAILATRYHAQPPFARPSFCSVLLPACPFPVGYVQSLPTDLSLDHGIATRGSARHQYMEMCIQQFNLHVDTLCMGTLHSVMYLILLCSAVLVLLSQSHACSFIASPF